MQYRKGEVSKMETVSFKIQGEFITNLAREKCHLEGNFSYAIELLTSCMENDALSKNEIYNMAIAILDGRAELKGTYPHEDYGFKYLDKKEDKWDIGKLINENFKKLGTSNQEYEELLQKYIFVNDSMAEWEKKKLNREYRQEYGKPMFNDMEEQQTSSLENAMLDSFVKRQMSNTKDDYGWLEPSGVFHPVEWGDHQEWANLWMLKNLSEDEYLEYDNASLAGDYLTGKGWILLHNPSQGIAFVTRSEECRLTKAQKEFLYKYYIDRDCEKEANEIFEE